MTTYQPGSFFVVEVTGLAGAGIYLGQFLAQSQSVYGHAGVIIDADGTTVEAEPGGARYGHLSDYAGRPLLVCDGPVQTWMRNREPWASERGPEWSEEYIRGAVARNACKLIGTPYSALDYLALALLHLHLPSRWVRRRVEKSGHMICSQLVDAVYERAGIHLYDDGRLPGDVMPADLDKWARDHGGAA